MLLIFPFVSFGQEEMKAKVDSLIYVEDMPYICRDNVESQNELSIGCGDKYFWNIVKQKGKAIPFLLEKLNDTTITNATVPNFSYDYSVADISYVALEEIVHGIPTFELLGIKFDQDGCGYCAYWQYLNSTYQNRVNFKAAVQNWFELNMDNLVWVANNNFSSCDCSGTHPNGGHYELIKK